MKLSRKLDKVIAEILKTGKAPAPGYEITRLERYSDQASLCLKDKDTNCLNILMGSKTIRIDGVLFDYPVFSRIQIVLGYGVVGRFFARPGEGNGGDE